MAKPEKSPPGSVDLLAQAMRRVFTEEVKTTAEDGEAEVVETTTAGEPRSQGDRTL